MRHWKSVCLLCFILLLFVMAGCSQTEEAENFHYYYSLMGDSENWEVNTYQIEITPEKVKAGNGTLTMKNSSEPFTDSYNIRVYVVAEGEERVIQGKSVNGNVELDIAEITTGVTESEDGNYLEPDKISTIYMEIEWNDKHSREQLEERIELFSD